MMETIRIRQLEEEAYHLRKENKRLFKENQRHEANYKHRDKLQHTFEQRCKKVEELLLEYGGVDGGHHKQWVIDRALRLSLGDNYETTIKEWCVGEDGPNTYVWNTGIAP